MSMFASLFGGSDEAPASSTPDDTDTTKTTPGTDAQPAKPAASSCECGLWRMRRGALADVEAMVAVDEREESVSGDRKAATLGLSEK